MSKAYKRQRSKDRKVRYDRKMNRDAAALLRRGGYNLDEVAALLTDIYSDESDGDLQANEVDNAHLKKAKKRRARELKVLNVDRHHLLYQRRFWSTDTYCELRSDWRLIVYMDISVHEELHAKVSPVLPIGSRLAARLVEHFRRICDCFESYDKDCFNKSALLGVDALIMALVLLSDDDTIKINQSDYTDIAHMMSNLMMQKEYIKKSQSLLADKCDDVLGYEPQFLRLEEVTVKVRI